MTAETSSELTEVLDKVRRWPSGLRITLARQILETVDASIAPPRRERGLSAAEIIRLIKPPQPAPTDAECRRILEEELLRKHSP